MNLFQKINPLEDTSFIKESLVFKKYKLINKIGKGAFGKVYSVQNINNKKTFAMKIEPLSSKNSNLQTEAFYLFSLQGFGIPKFITFGHNKTYNILVEELLGKSLDFIFIKNNIKCTLNDACLIAIQLIERFQWIHSKDIIYRDLKPENCLIGKNYPNIIYLIDFGLCKKYRSSKTGKHILPKRTDKFSGTMKFTSFYALSGKEQSR